jgi:hypothetical protein
MFGTQVTWKDMPPAKLIAGGDSLLPGLHSNLVLIVLVLRNTA